VQMCPELDEIVLLLIEIATIAVSEHERHVSKAEKPLLDSSDVDKIREVARSQILAKFNEVVFGNDPKNKVTETEWIDRTTIKAKWLFSSKLARKKVVKRIEFSLLNPIGAVTSLGKSTVGAVTSVGKSGFDVVSNVGKSTVNIVGSGVAVVGSGVGKVAGTVGLGGKEEEKPAEAPKEGEGQPHREGEGHPPKEEEGHAPKEGEGAQPPHHKEGEPAGDHKEEPKKE
jgi:hypothetical protein